MAQAAPAEPRVDPAELAPVLAPVLGAAAALVDPAAQPVVGLVAVAEPALPVDPAAALVVLAEEVPAAEPVDPAEPVLEVRAARPVPRVALLPVARALAELQVQAVLRRVEEQAREQALRVRVVVLVRALRLRPPLRLRR